LTGHRADPATGNENSPLRPLRAGGFRLPGIFDEMMKGFVKMLLKNNKCCQNTD
jgi:hypothetical protein